jgi:predicted phosphate transport protein (TIGR00153 family)
MAVTPFDLLADHSEKVKECAWIFQQAMECHMTLSCNSYNELKQEVVKLEIEADGIKHQIRKHMPSSLLMPVDKYQFFYYLMEQDHILDSVIDALTWMEYRERPALPPELEKDFFLLVDAIIDPVEELSRMVRESEKYFRKFSDKQREIVQEIIRTIRQQHHQADQVEERISQQVFRTKTDPLMVFHTVRLVEKIGSVADHAENACNMMRAMIIR